ncbi:DUF6507 family protein [Streptomyces specialis]|uniref:DUF6507 family protein n=1 Tax=Streptomyces specialis TaxID=498367 RepID=UPI00073F932D|nr:DUF6507 family protein [Streptomyces specialis]
MPDWDIDPQGVRDVLTSTAETAGRLEGWGTGYQESLRSAASSAGTLYMGGAERPEAGLVGAALAEFAEKTQEDLQYIAARASASLNGALQATVEYLNGDMEMAERAQRNALAEPDLETPPADEQGGGR